MIGMKIGKIQFFPQVVISAADKATRFNLSKFGAFVRRRAKSSIRKRKKPSQPGSPPSSHSGRLKKLILWHYDDRTQNVAIGSALSNRVSFAGESLKPVRGTVPQTLEEGGSLWVVEERWASGEWYRVDLRRRGARAKVDAARRGTVRRDVRKRKITMKARPFMVPAFNKEKPGLDSLWKDSIK